jgi:hypothetical protein
MLTDTMLRNIKPGAKLAEFWDTRVPGLCLRVSPGGTRTWAFRYRPKGAASQKRVSLGRYPETTLAAARKLAEGLRADVAGGADPQGEREAARTADRKALTFDNLAGQYIERYAGAIKNPGNSMNSTSGFTCGRYGAFEKQKPSRGLMPPRCSTGSPNPRQ